jgi:prepilin-type processing-associated H-X9-DG protein
MTKDAFGDNGIGTLQNGNCGSFGFGSFTDGTSNTVMFSEKLVGSGPLPPQVTRNHPNARRGYGWTISQANPIDQGVTGVATAQSFVNLCKAVPGNAVPKGSGLGPGNGLHWIGGNPGSCLIWCAYNHFMPPNTVQCIASNDGNTEAWGSVMNAIPPSSNHPGGVNCAMTDGSVRFIKDTINLQTWWAIGTRAGGEIVSSDAL